MGEVMVGGGEKERGWWQMVVKAGLRQNGFLLLLSCETHVAVPVLKRQLEKTQLGMLRRRQIRELAAASNTELIHTQPRRYLHECTSKNLSLLQVSSPKGGGWLQAGPGSPGTQGCPSVTLPVTLPRTPSAVLRFCGLAHSSFR